MENSEVIARLSKENLELKDKLEAVREETDKINSILHCIGGPLNDNVREYSRDQLIPFFCIREAVISILNEIDCSEE